MKLITELPHANYHSGNINQIDFQIEKMPISTDQKKTLARAFLSGKGIIGKMAKTNKFFLFTPGGVKVLKNEPKDKSMILPINWQKYAVILKDEITSNLVETIRKIVREVLNEKWKIEEDKSYIWVNPKTKKEYDLQSVNGKWEMDIKRAGNRSFSKPVIIKRDTLDQIKDWLNSRKISTKWIK